nr:adhesion G protein-coupled receptor E1-like [Labrus bergylta]
MGIPQGSILGPCGSLFILGHSAYPSDHSNCTADSCGPLAQCTSGGGCVCITGYEIPADHLPTLESFGCVDIDECVKTAGICGSYSTCENTIGSHLCTCLDGFTATDATSPVSTSNPCQDIDECFNSTVCGPESKCTNTPGAYTCACNLGYEPTTPDQEPSEENICIDVDECEKYAAVCGPHANCTNSIGSYFCVCFSGFRLNNLKVIASHANPCTDIDECSETPGICGLQNILDEIEPAETVANGFAASMEVSGVGPHAKSSRVSSKGDGETGSLILGISDRLVSSLVQPGQNKTKRSVKGSAVDLSLETIGPGVHNAESSVLTAKGNSMAINLDGLADNNNGSAAAAFLTITGMESLLSHNYFKTENQTEMYSDIITAILPSINNTNLTEPVNFTIQHKTVPENGFVTCVYWEDKTEETGQRKKRTLRWSVEGCWVAYTTENVTVCSCSHLSTFALIMQIGEPPAENPFLDWLNRMCVMVGLAFFGLAIFTFLLCSWNPKINNTARLHLCLNLAFSHLLLLWNDRYTEHELACTVMAGLLHFLVVASFVWMLLEALQLHLLVRRLSKVQVIQRDGLPRVLLYLIGYGVPFVIVGVSALVYSDGYGATEAEVCWLSRNRNFNWALTGPVIVILGLNWMLFCATLWSLRPTLANMRSDVSQSKDTRLIVFKILAQFVILGCTWILGLYQTNLFFQVLFIILNSQQGTFLFIVHCLLNKEVREEYMKWLTCSFNKQRHGGSVKDVPSVSEDLDKCE